ncbi:nucleolar transcription factor 1-B-like isoform X1 [Argonauta hians]
MLTLSNSEIRKGRELYEKRMVKGLTLLHYFLKSGGVLEAENMSDAILNETATLENGNATFEDSPEMNAEGEVNIKVEEDVNLEDVDTESGKKKRKKHKKHKKENDELVEDETTCNLEENIEPVVKKRKKSKRHEESVVKEEQEEMIAAEDDNNVEETSYLETETKKKKKKHKHKKKKLNMEKEDDDGNDNDNDNNSDIKVEHPQGNNEATSQIVESSVGADSNKVETSSKISTWPKDDVLELLQLIEKILSVSPDLKGSQLWESIKFGSYTPADCKAMYTVAVSKIRKTRTTLEIVKDAIVTLPTLQTSKTKAVRKSKPKPITPLKLYMDSHLKKFMSKHPNLRQIDALNRVTKQWTSLEDRKKLKYINMALEGEQKYSKEVDEYKSIDPYFRPKPILAKVEEKLLYKTMGLPEKPCSNSFGLFVKMSGNLQLTGENSSRLKELSKIYNELPSDVKEDYENRAKTEQQEYWEKVKEYCDKLSETDRTLSVNKKLYQEYQKYLGRKTIPNSKFMLYYKEHHFSLVGFTKAEKYKTLMERWKMLPTVEHDKYNSKRIEMKKAAKTNSTQLQITFPPAN